MIYGREQTGTYCRDRGWKRGRVGPCACPSCEGDSLALQVPYESCGKEDRHKAPTLPLFHPLSLQDEGDVSCHSPIRLSKIIRTGRFHLPVLSLKIVRTTERSFPSFAHQPAYGRSCATVQVSIYRTRWARWGASRSRTCSICPRFVGRTARIVQPRWAASR